MNPFAMLSGLEGNEQKKFIKWLKQYETVSDIDVFFEEHPELLQADDATEDVKQLEGLARKTFSAPKPGQIRLLERGVTNDPDACIPILILSQWEGDQRWLAAPFSQFTKPAIPGELDTGIEYHAYRVVEAWNAFVIPEFLLHVQTSYLREAGESVRKDACTVFFSQLRGTSIPEELSSRVGPRIMYEYDPRIQYILSEQKQFAPLRAMIKEYDESMASLEEPMFEAAAGKNYLSAGYIRTGGRLVPLQVGIKAESDFQPVEKKEELPLFTWYMDELPDECFPGMTVYFQTTQQKVLGTGRLEGNPKDGYEVSLEETVSSQETPAIESPADIILVFCKD